MEIITLQLNHNDFLQIQTDSDQGIITIIINEKRQTYPISAMILELFSKAIFKAVKGDIENLVDEFQWMKAEENQDDNDYYDEEYDDNNEE